ncbi:nickel-dependent hydrogenase large subunit, partial [Elusimicrobiota bacterium]
MHIIDGLLGGRQGSPRSRYKVKAGRGTAAVEVPRGILYHHYKLDKKGKIAQADCVIPTTQNHANIHHDLRELVKQQVRRKKGDKEITLL